MINQFTTYMRQIPLVRLRKTEQNYIQLQTFVTQRIWHIQVIAFSTTTPT